jgi:CheY-like chemotaxis protein
VRMKLSVQSTVFGGDGALRVEVMDSGVGIKPDNVARLFREVIQFDAALLQNGGGSGLGLTITKAIMEAHGGKIGVSSVYHQGSCFFADIAICERAVRRESFTRSALASLLTRAASFGLPNASGVEADTAANGSTSTGPRAIGTKRVGRLLIVDDTNTHVTEMKKLFSSFADEILSAEDGLAAAEQVKASLAEGGRPIDMVVTDYHMPRMDGMELAAHARGIGYKGFLVMLSTDCTTSGNKLKTHFLCCGGDEMASHPLTLQSVQKILDLFFQKSSPHSGGDVDAEWSDGVVQHAAADIGYTHPLHHRQTVSSHTEEEGFSSHSSGMVYNLSHTPVSITSRTSSRASSMSLSRHILIVDDSKLNLKMMQKRLAKYADLVSSAEDGLAAAEQVKASLAEGGRPIDMVVTDYRMPRMDGMELAAHARGIGYKGFLVMLSGDPLTGDGELKKSFESQGGNLVFGKPFSLDSCAKMFSALDEFEEHNLLCY